MEDATRRISNIQGHLTPNNTASCPASGGKCPSTGGKCPSTGGKCQGGSCCQGSSSNQSGVCPVTGHSSKTPSRFTDPNPIRVVVTGAAGNIAYSLIFMIASGRMFGPSKPVILHLLDIPPMAQALNGVEMEIRDCAFPLVKGVVATTDVKTGFMHVDVAILVGAFPRQKGMERKDLLKKNAAIFKEHGRAINDFASRDVKVVVVGNPANTNCLIALTCAPDIPKENFSALTRLDHNRAISQVADKLGVAVDDVKNVIIWGNHSATQYPDVSFASVRNFGPSGVSTSLRSAINDESWVNQEFISSVQQRGAKIIEARKLSSAASAAHAVVCHVRDWVLGTREGEIVSMAVYSDGSYGTPQGVIYSFPVTCSQGKWTIVQGLPISEFSKKKMQATAEELLEEKKDAFSFLDDK
eukprot:TRINITY_DN9430_c0_g1_i1.p1 TRINITY_DN9430_c0_g1~~TRINITY_DN9430_c0_g1_i1.p1  ORF type:complete len:412 (+),score=89.56 TRINITY_DN9430_c0_g1_i1:490-1725(+)